MVPPSQPSLPPYTHYHATQLADDILNSIVFLSVSFILSNFLYIFMCVCMCLCIFIRETTLKNPGVAVPHVIVVRHIGRPGTLVKDNASELGLGQPGGWRSGVLWVEGWRRGMGGRG